MINALTRQKDLSKTSASPGRTRLLNVFDINHTFLFIDLPGYGYAKASRKDRERYEELIYEYLTQEKRIRLVCVVIDAKVGTTELDLEMIGFLQSGQLPYAIIANKIDKLSRTEAASLMQRLTSSFPRVPVLPHAATTGVGRSEVLSLIQTFV